MFSKPLFMVIEFSTQALRSFVIKVRFAFKNGRSTTTGAVEHRGFAFDVRSSTITGEHTKTVLFVKKQSVIKNKKCVYDYGLFKST